MRPEVSRNRPGKCAGKRANLNAYECDYVFYVLRAFFPSLPGGCRHADLGIKAPPASVSLRGVRFRFAHVRWHFNRRGPRDFVKVTVQSGGVNSLIISHGDFCAFRDPDFTLYDFVPVVRNRTVRVQAGCDDG
jgi:hypothetical protein